MRCSVRLGMVEPMDSPSYPPESPSHTPFMAHLEPHYASAQDGNARLELKLQPWQRNGMGVAHGGVIMTLLDAVMAMAAKSADPAGARAVA